MIELYPGQIAAALVILPCVDLDETVEYFVGTLGFRLASISPADDPRTAVLEGHGRGSSCDGTTPAIRVTCACSTESRWWAANGRSSPRTAPASS